MVDNKETDDMQVDISITPDEQNVESNEAPGALPDSKVLEEEEEEESKPKHKVHHGSHKKVHKKSHESHHKHESHKHVSHKKKVEDIWYKKPSTWIIAALVLVVVVMGFKLHGPATDVVKPVDGVVEIIEFTDFGCPYCARGAGTMDALKEKYGDNVKITFKHFPIAQLHPNSQKAHEASECARDQDKFKEYHDWLFANQQKHDLDSLRAAAADLGLDVAEFNECLDSDAKASIVKNDFNEGMAKGVSSTPTFYVGGKLVKGAQPQAQFEKMIDASLGMEGAEVEAVKIVVLNDKRCLECDISPIYPQLEQLFYEVDFEELDYNSEEGKALYEATGLSAVPALLFDESIKSESAYANIERFMVPAGDYLSLNIGAEFDPTAEICDNSVDDTGNGLVDCEDATCKDTMVCREEIAGDLKVFIMSDCPYGRLAVEALKEVVDNFGDDIDYSVHYIATETAPGEFRSLHGQYEVDENIIQLCVMDKSPKVSLDYLYCRSTKGVKGIDWKECAEETGVDVEAVAACFEDGSGAALLSEDIKIANGLGVSGSPTWLANNKYQFGGIDAATVQSNICNHNEFDACDATLTASAGAPAGSCN